MFFRKTPICERCGAAVGKKDACIFDYSRQGRAAGQQKIQVCPRCCREELIRNFKNHTQKAVIVCPSEPYNAYAFYGFEELLGFARRSADEKRQIRYVEEMRNLLPDESARCVLCSRKAVYTWCTLDIYRKGDPFAMRVNPEEKHVFLCRDCLIDRLDKTLREKNIGLRYVYPMADESPGFYTPWSV